MGDHRFEDKDRGVCERRDKKADKREDTTRH